jgi:4'-phosphopantetheinyl transferase
MSVSLKGGAKVCYASGSIEVLVTRLDAQPEAVHALAATLSDAERQRAARFRFVRDRRRFIVARARLRELLAARLGVRPESIELAYGRYGKPELAGRFAGAGWRFNISHCEDVALHALCAGGEVGTDVEAIRPVREADRIAAGYFSCRENAAYRALPALDKPLGFLRCWTRKEAFVKALGGGLSSRLAQLDVSESSLVESFAPLPGFIAAVATPGA